MEEREYRYIGVTKKKSNRLLSMKIRDKETNEVEAEWKHINKDQNERNLCRFIKQKEKQGIKVKMCGFEVPAKSFIINGLEPPVWAK